MFSGLVRPSRRIAGAMTSAGPTTWSTAPWTLVGTNRIFETNRMFIETSVSSVAVRELPVEPIPTLAHHGQAERREADRRQPPRAARVPPLGPRRGRTRA